MKKSKLLSLIQEDKKIEEPKLINMNEDSFYDGYKFVEYGKNIPNISLILPSNDSEDFSIEKNKVVINWGVKFQFRNSGIEGTQIEILNLTAPIIGVNNGVKREIEVNYGEYRFEISKEKNVENKDVQMQIMAVEVDVENKIVNVVVEI